MGEQTVLYRYFDKDDVLLYVGISNNFILRLYQHERDKGWAEYISSITLSRFPDRKAALFAEYNAILNENPVHNKQCYAPREKPFGWCATISVDQDVMEIIGNIKKQGDNPSRVVCNLLRFYRDNDYRIPPKQQQSSPLGEVK